jgi:uncharacterized RDD family membrane protein YckC
MTTTTPVTAPPAPVGRRIAAALIDGALTSVAAGVIYLSVLPAYLAALRGTDDPGTVTVNPVLVVVGLVLLLAWGGVQWWFHGTQGWTVGRRILGLRVVDVRTARPIGLGRALGRTLVLSLSSLACGVGQLVVLASILFDGSGKHRGWHDRAADAIVVDVRGLPAAARVAAAPRPAAGPVPGAPGAPGDGVAPGPVAPGSVAPDGSPVPGAAAPSGAEWSASGAEEQERTRWGALAADRRLDDPHLVLPPLGTPGPGPDLDTRALPVIPGGSAYPAPGAAVPVSVPGGRRCRAVALRRAGRRCAGVVPGARWSRAVAVPGTCERLRPRAEPVPRAGCRRCGTEPVRPGRGGLRRRTG